MYLRGCLALSVAFAAAPARAQSTEEPAADASTLGAAQQAVDADPTAEAPIALDVEPIAVGAAPIDVMVRGKAPPRSPSQARRGRAVLEAAPAQTASDLLDRVPGLFVTQHSGEGKAHQIFFRGFDAVHGQDLEIIAGGIPINDVSNVHGQGYADLHFLVPEVVETIVALPGAFDPAQGDFAVAGTIRLSLGYPETGLTLKTTYGSFGTRRLFAAYRPEGAPPQTFIAAEVYATDGFGAARQARRASTIGQVVVPLARGLSLRVLTSAYTGRFESAGVLRQSDIEAGVVRRFTSHDPDQGGAATRAQLGAELSFARDGWSGSLMPFVVRRTMRLRYNFTGALVDPLGDGTDQTNASTTYGLRGRVDKYVPLLSPHDSIGGGIYLRHDRIYQTHASIRPGGSQRVDASVLATDVGGFVDAALRFIPRTVVRGGVRVDGLFFAVDDHLAGAARAAEGVQVSPRATVDVAIVPGLHALAAYGMGFRSPQARGLADGEHSPFTRLHGFETGLRVRSDRIQASLAGFATLLDEDIVFNETTSRNERVQGTLRLGLALDVSARIRDLFVSALGASLTRATFQEDGPRFAEGDLLPFVPQLVVRSDTALTPKLGHLAGREVSLRIGYGTSLLFSRPLPYGEIGDDVFLVDALTGVRIGEVEFIVEVENLLDAAWYDGQFVYASTFGAATALPQRHVTAGRPRTILGTLALHL